MVRALLGAKAFAGAKPRVALTYDCQSTPQGRDETLRQAPWGPRFPHVDRCPFTRKPEVDPLDSKTSGRLPPSEIQGVVRASFGPLRACYEAGLRADPKLEGRVETTFVINRDGSVSSPVAIGEVPESMKRRITAIVAELRFPEPEGGIVTVRYPIVFTPGG